MDHRDGIRVGFSWWWYGEAVPQPAWHKQGAILTSTHKAGTHKAGGFVVGASYTLDGLK
jgi:hypothetical protein